MAEPPLKSVVVEADFFQQVGYSTVWEDERIISEGLRPQAGERVLSITSGGDFSLHCLLASPARVLSLDFNPRQSFLLELKTAAAACLDHQGLWAFLGLAPSSARLRSYQGLRSALTPQARRYWDGRRRALKRGVLLCGKQDRYLHRVGRALRLLQGPRKVRRLFSAPDLASQREAFLESWSGRRWRLLCRILFSRQVLNRAFHKDHFRYAAAGAHPAEALRRQAEEVLRDLPLAENFYLHWLFFARYPDRERCPAWLRASNFEALRANLPALEVRTGELERTLGSLASDSIDVFNFSNIFDWVSQEVFLALMRQVVRVARPGARLCYWTNMVNTRRELGAAAALLPSLSEDPALAASIFRRCRTPGYSSCTLGHIAPPDSSQEPP